MVVPRRGRLILFIIFSTRNAVSPVPMLMRRVCVYPRGLATVSLVQYEMSLERAEAVAFSVISDKDACYRWIQRELVKFRYLQRSHLEKGGGSVT